MVLQHGGEAHHNLLQQRELLLSQAEFPLDASLPGARPVQTVFLRVSKDVSKRHRCWLAVEDLTRHRFLTLREVFVETHVQVIVHEAREDVRSACILV